MASWAAFRTIDAAGRRRYPVQVLFSKEEDVSEAPHKVVPEGDETATYACGHEGPARYAHEIFGRTLRLRDEVLAKRDKCAQCLLDEVTDGATKCARCGTPIFKGQDCIMYDDGVCCLSTACGPGPIAAMPGIWDGERFVDGFAAGTITVIDLP